MGMPYLGVATIDARMIGLMTGTATVLGATADLIRHVILTSATRLGAMGIAVGTLTAVVVLPPARDLDVRHHHH